MGIKFEWRIEEEEDWEDFTTPLTETNHFFEQSEEVPFMESEGPPSRPRRWKILITLLVVGLSLIFSGITVWYLSWRNFEEIKAELKEAMELEHHSWRASKESIVWEFKSPQHIIHISSMSKPKGEIADLKLVGNMAWVEVRWSWKGVAYKKVEFYNLENGQWKRTDPDERYWGEKRERKSEHLRFIYPERDEKLVANLMKEGEHMYLRICEDLGVAPWDKRICFLVEPFFASRFGYKALDEPHWRLESPLLIGTPADDTPSEWLKVQLAERLAFSLIGRTVESEDFIPHGTLLGAIARWEARRLVPEVKGWSFVIYQIPTQPKVDESHWTFLSTPFHWKSSRSDEPLSLEELWERRWDYRIDGMPGLAFQHDVFVEYIAEEYGPEKIRGILAYIWSRKPFDEVVREVFGTSLEEFEAGWLAFMEVKEAPMETFVIEASVEQGLWQLWQALKSNLHRARVER